MGRFCSTSTKEGLWMVVDGRRDFRMSCLNDSVMLLAFHDNADYFVCKMFLNKTINPF